MFGHCSYCEQEHLLDPESHLCDACWHDLYGQRDEEIAHEHFLAYQRSIQEDTPPQ